MSTGAWLLLLYQEQKVTFVEPHAKSSEANNERATTEDGDREPTNPCCWEIITLKGTPGTEKICFDTDYRKLHHTSKFTHLSAHVSDNHKSTPSPHTHLQLPQKLKTVGLVLILHYVYN